MSKQAACEKDKAYLRTLSDERLACVASIAASVLKSHDFHFNARVVKEAARRLARQK